MSAEQLVPGLCRYLAGAVSGLVFDEVGAAGNVFDTTLPADPDEVTVLREYDGEEPDSLIGYDTVYVQVRTRGPKDDPRPSRTRIHAIRSALEGLTNVTLPGGPYVVLVHSRQPPIPLDGTDSLGRHEHVLNVAVEVHNPTNHRQ